MYEFRKFIILGIICFALVLSREVFEASAYVVPVIDGGHMALTEKQTLVMKTIATNTEVQEEKRSKLQKIFDESKWAQQFAEWAEAFNYYTSMIKNQVEQVSWLVQLTDENVRIRKVNEWLYEGLQTIPGVPDLFGGVKNLYEIKENINYLEDFSFTPQDARLFDISFWGNGRQHPTEDVFYDFKTPINDWVSALKKRTEHHNYRAWQDELRQKSFDDRNNTANSALDNSQLIAQHYEESKTLTSIYKDTAGQLSSKVAQQTLVKISAEQLDTQMEIARINERNLELQAMETKHKLVEDQIEDAGRKIDEMIFGANVYEHINLSTEGAGEILKDE